jgi:hypothetical protein
LLLLLKLWRMMLRSSDEDGNVVEVLALRS